MSANKLRNSLPALHSARSGLQNQSHTSLNITAVEDTYIAHRGHFERINSARFFSTRPCARDASRVALRCAMTVSFQQNRETARRATASIPCESTRRSAVKTV
jgi:hypothetical protein